MVGKELVVSKGSPVNLRDVAMRQSLRLFQQKGHSYVELRQSGKRMIFFCTLCLAPCYSETVLSDHLNGNLHAQRLSAAKLTLFGPTPWPFSDGVLFFDTCSEKEPVSPLLDSQNSKALVVHNQNSDKEDEVTSRSGLESDSRALDVLWRSNEFEDRVLIIPRVLVKEEVSCLRVRYLGAGQIAYRIQETEGQSSITRMWCAWLGQGEDNHDNGSIVPACSDFAVVNCPYAYGLGKSAANDDDESPASPGSFFEIDDSGRRKKKKKSFSDPEDSSESLSEHCSNPQSVAADDPEQLDMRLIPSKTARRELRKRKRLASERICDICGHPMLPGKDVATLLNCKTGRLACSSRNTNGAFHPFHASCLIHWIILCELEMLNNPVSNTKTGRGRKGKPKQKDGITSVFCPECQGTGICIKGEELEKPSVPLSQTFLYKLKAIDANKAWMKDPEVLQNCSTGLHFPSKLVGNSQEKVVPMKSLRFFRVAK